MYAFRTTCDIPPDTGADDGGGARLIARGQSIQPTVPSAIVGIHQDSIVHVPIHDRPPLPLALIWRTAHGNARSRALARTPSALRAETGAG